ncbi:MAG: oligosaccharide flippase family protein [Lachnospiraceae bacterium]|nr:oligosaccharide flippase family protein [Lachnospiraceae bacterium]
MKLSKKLNYLLKNIGYITVGNFASRLMSFILVPVYTTKLSTAEYGSVDLVFTTLSLLLPILSLEINEAVLRFSLSENVTKKDSIFSIGVAISSFSFFIFIVLFPITLFFETFREYWLYIIMLYMTNVVYVCLSQFAKGNRYIKEYSICGFIHTIITAFLNILFLVVFECKVNGYLLSYILGYIFASLYLVIILYKDIKILSFRKIERSDVKQMLRYSVPLIPNAVCWWINNASDKYILAIFCNTAMVGLYSIAYKIPSLLSVVSSIFFSAWQISAVDDFGKKECQVFYSKIYRAFFILNALVCVILITGSKQIAYILYANDFFDAWRYSVILICAYFINALSTFLGTIYTTSQKTKMLLLSSLIAAIINIVMNLLLIPIFGAFGAAIATLASYGVVFVVRIYDTRKIIPLSYNIIECMFLFGIMIGSALTSLSGNAVINLTICGLAIIYNVFILCKSLLPHLKH